MVQRADRPATYADIEALPPHVTGQIIAGTLYTNARPASQHAVASGGIFDEVSGPFQRGRGGPGGWVILFEPELHFGRDVIVPDLAGWRRTRMPEVPRVPWFELAPDWVCEILSPSTAGLDRVKKRALYARERVPYVWLVDPDGRTLEVLRLEGERYADAGAFEGDARVRAEPFEAIEIELAALWSL
jgi:Uma2 family endonuclease